MFISSIEIKYNRAIVIRKIYLRKWVKNVFKKNEFE